MTSRYEREAEKVLALAGQKAESAEVWCADSERIPVRFKDNKLKMLEASSSNGIALRVIADGKIGFAASTKMDAASDLVEKALATAQFGTPAEFDFPGPGDYPGPRVFDPAVADLEADALVETGAAILEKILAYEKHVQASISLDRGTGRVRLLNTEGVDLKRETTGISLWCTATLVEDESLLHTGDMMGSRFMYTEPEKVADRIIEQIRVGRKRAPIAEGRYPVIFSPWALSSILRPFMSCVDGDAVSRGISPWRGRTGEVVADERLSLYDDGLMEGGLGTAPWDDEGIPAQRTPLIEDGVLKNFLVDLKNSARLDLPPTGNGSRGGLGSLPGISTSNIYLEEGDIPYEEMLSSIKEGILVHQLMGAWGSNPYGGQISGNIGLGFKIENGEPVGRVKDCMLYLNGFEAWKDQLSAISSDVRQAVSFRFPYVLMEGVSISGRG